MGGRVGWGLSGPGGPDSHVQKADRHLEDGDDGATRPAPCLGLLTSSHRGRKVPSALREQVPLITASRMARITVSVGRDPPWVWTDGAAPAARPATAPAIDVQARAFFAQRRPSRTHGLTPGAGGDRFSGTARAGEGSTALGRRGDGAPRSRPGVAGRGGAGADPGPRTWTLPPLRLSFPMRRVQFISVPAACRRLGG